jgi:hypothetical protein
VAVICRPSVVLGLPAVVLGPALGCVTSRTLEPRPNGSLEVRGGGVEARVKRVHLKWGSYKDQGPDQVVIEVANHTPRKLRLIPTKIQVAALKETLPPQRVPLKKTDLAVPALGNPVGASVAGARIGVRLSGAVGSPTGGVVGAAGGAALGAAGMVAVMVPVGAYLLVDRLLRESDRTIAAGKTRSLRISLGQVALEAGDRYALDLRGALEPAAPELGPLPLVDLADPSYGYGSPSSLRWVWALRLGGGAIWEGPTTGGLGGAELFVGRQWRRLAVGAYAMLGAGSVGLETRYRVPLGRWVTLVPFVGYGYIFGAGRFGWAVGHGPRAGLELDFNLGMARRMNYERAGMTLGLFGHVGPAFIHERDDPGITAQFGIVLGMF